MILMSLLAHGLSAPVPNFAPLHGRVAEPLPGGCRFPLRDGQPQTNRRSPARRTAILIRRERAEMAALNERAALEG